MTTTEPTPADDFPDEAGDALTLAKNGWVRLQIGDEMLRLRPPFFGEYKDARHRVEDVSAQVEDHADDVAAQAEVMAAEVEALEADESLDDRERSKRRRAIQRKSVKVGRALTEMQEPLWLAWWADTIGTLCVSKGAATKLVAELTEDHEKMPPYMASAGTALAVLGHWRAGPLGRGLQPPQQQPRTDQAPPTSK